MFQYSCWCNDRGPLGEKCMTLPGRFAILSAQVHIYGRLLFLVSGAMVMRHKNRWREIAVLAGMLVIAGTAVAAVRTWTNTKGKSIEAEFLSSADGKVQVRRADGKENRVDPRGMTETKSRGPAAAGGRGQLPRRRRPGNSARFLPSAFRADGTIIASSPSSQASRPIAWVNDSSPFR